MSVVDAHVEQRMRVEKHHYFAGSFGEMESPSLEIMREQTPGFERIRVAESRSDRVARRATKNRSYSLIGDGTLDFSEL
jgi:hypothetical protein